MKVQKIEDEKKKLVVEVDGEDNSLVNLLVDESLDSGAVSAFGRQQHPMVPKLTITVAGDNPKSTLEKAAKNVEKLAKAFQTGFK